MKKLLTLLLTLLMVFTLVGCDSNKEDTPVVEEPEQQGVVDEPIVGGYTEVEDKNLTPELIEMFNKAFEGFTGGKYTPLMLEATQVVAGTNYKFKADGTKTTNPIIMGTYYVYINKDLQGNVSLLDIEVIEEHEVKEFVPEGKIDIKKDYTGVKFWVVVYDQFNNEVSRTTAVYGSTVKDPDGNDVVVNGNKYFHTVIDYPTTKDDGPTPEPTPSSPCLNEDKIYLFTYVYYDETTGNYEVQYDTYAKNGNSFAFENHYGGLKQFTGDAPNEYVVYHSNDGETFVECDDNNHHNIMLTITFKGAKIEYNGRPIDGSFPTDTIQCPLGSTYSENSDGITINGIKYPFIGNTDGLYYAGWEWNPFNAFDISGEKIYSNCEIYELYWDI